MTNRSKDRTQITDTTAEMARAVQDDPLLALAMGLPGMIDHQGRVGQRELVESEQLPCRGLLGQDWARWEAFGVRILDADAGTTSASDPLFCRVQLPPGWARRATGHPMWSDLIDGLGRVRGRVFYKAAFYDRSAFLRMEPRFQISRNLDRDDWEASTSCRVQDGGRTIFETATVARRLVGDLESAARRDALFFDEAVEQVLCSTCLAWLADRGVADPDDASAYWDHEVLALDRAPTPRVPVGKSSGVAAVARATELQISLRIGEYGRSRRCEVAPSCASALVAAGVCSADLFWIDEPSTADAGEGS